MAGAAPAEPAAVTREDTSPVARLVGISQICGQVFALDDLSLCLPSGCIVGLIGPDWVGKSSVLAIVAGVRRMQSGKAFVLGGDIGDAAHRAQVCPRIAYMPQGLGKNLYPDLSIRENIDFCGRLFGRSRAERQARVADRLDNTGLATFADRPAKKLSGGNTPLESMPLWLATIMQASPTVHFVSFAQAILYRGAGFQSCGGNSSRPHSSALHPRLGTPTLSESDGMKKLHSHD
jgi:ABC-type polysaccharide/polyol phosphate transport system ATPase subunit